MSKTHFLMILALVFTIIFVSFPVWAGSKPVQRAYWPDFDNTAPYLLGNALWVGWDAKENTWKYYKEFDTDRGITDPGNPKDWSLNGTTIGYFDGDLDALPPGTHINNRYNPAMMAYRCNQDDIQVKVGSFWIDKYACRIIDVGPSYSSATWKDGTSDMTTSANSDVPPILDGLLTKGPCLHRHDLVCSSPVCC